MNYRITVAAVGCLPDSESYPYTVDGIEEAEDALRQELNTHIPEEVGAADFESAVTSGLANLREEGAVTVPLQGTYVLTVVPA